MLKLTLLPDEYLMVGENIVVQLLRVSGGRADVAIEAPRTVPVVRGAVLERQGGRSRSSAPPGRRRRRRHGITATRCSGGTTTGREP